MNSQLQSADWMPSGIALVTSGSRGKRVLFYHVGVRATETYDEDLGILKSVKDVLSELTSRTLAEILAPSSLSVGHKFELNVDEWKFVGHPFSVQTSSFNIAFNVVFVLQSYFSPDVVNSYAHLSHLIGSAIVHEEHKCKYLSREVALLLQLLEDADIPDPTSEKTMKESSLAESLSFVLSSLQRGDPHVRVRINEWSEVNILMAFGAQCRESQDPDIRAQCVRSYSALLLLERSESIVESLPPSCNPSFHRLLKTISPMKSLQTVSLDADIPLAQVLHFASHLVYWGKAIAIYPLSESNVYFASPIAETRLESEISWSFSDAFPGLPLLELLSKFSLPISLGDLKQEFIDERIIPMVVWLLRHRQINQLHTYVYIVPMSSNQLQQVVQSPSPVSSGFGSDHTSETIATAQNGRPPSLSPDSGQTDEGSDSSLAAQLLHHLSREEQQSVLHIANTLEYEDMELFVRLCKYFHGSHHLEEIILRENIPRSQLLTLIDKFSQVLVPCTLPEHGT